MAAIPIQDLPRLNYSAVRTTLRDADIILCRGHKLLHSAIRAFTNGEFNHAAIAYWWGSRIVMLESGTRGVATIHLSKFIRKYPGDVYLARVSGVTADIATRIRDAAIDDLWDEYDTMMMARMAARKLLGKIGFKFKPVENDKWYCSEWVRHLYLKGGGIEFQFDQQGVISPSAIGNNPSVEILGKIEDDRLFTVGPDGSVSGRPEND